MNALAKKTVNFQTVKLRELTASALSREPAKVIALKLGISHRQVENLRSGLLLPHVPTFLEIAKRDPQLRAHVMAILGGEAEAGSSASIDELVRIYTRGTP